jgi:RimJ/RimL family protein N-acetyltransferase
VPACELGDYLVSPRYRGQGIMKNIQNELIHLAKEMKFRVVTSTVHHGNMASLSVLSKHLHIAKTADYNGYSRHLMRLDL